MWGVSPPLKEQQFQDKVNPKEVFAHEKKIYVYVNNNPKLERNISGTRHSKNPLQTSNELLDVRLRFD